MEERVPLFDTNTSLEYKIPKLRVFRSRWSVSMVSFWERILLSFSFLLMLINYLRKIVRASAPCQKQIWRTEKSRRLNDDFSCWSLTTRAKTMIPLWNSQSKAVWLWAKDIDGFDSSMCSCVVNRDEKEKKTIWLERFQWRVWSWWITSSVYSSTFLLCFRRGSIELKDNSILQEGNVLLSQHPLPVWVQCIVSRQTILHQSILDIERNAFVVTRVELKEPICFSGFKSHFHCSWLFLRILISIWYVWLVIRMKWKEVSNRKTLISSFYWKEYNSKSITVSFEKI